MNIQIGMNCQYESLCEHINFAFGYLFLGLLIWFVGYLVYLSVKDKK